MRWALRWLAAFFRHTAAASPSYQLERARRGRMQEQGEWDEEVRKALLVDVPWRDGWTPTIAVDFDGVIHWYREGWKGAENVYDDPVPGTREALDRLSASNRVVVMSSRARTDGGRTAIWSWLEEHDLARFVADVTAEKVAAVVYIDDRGVQFNGSWVEAIKAVESYHNWLK